MIKLFKLEFYTLVEMIPLYRHHINKCVNFDTDITQNVFEKKNSLVSGDIGIKTENVLLCESSDNSKTTLRMCFCRVTY